MKKNYLLMFLIALLFGTATMRGQSVPFHEIKATEGYIMKVGTAYLVLKDGTTIATTTKKEEATLLSVNPEQNGNISSIVSKKDHGDNILAYKDQRKGKFKLAQAQDGQYYAFLYKQENGKYYLQATKGNANGKYLSCASGVLSLEENISANAIIELTDPNGSSDAEVTLNAKKMRETLALFQAKRKGQDHFPNGFFGTGLGQYPQPTLANNVFDYVTYNIYLEGHAAIGNGNASSEMEKMKTLKDALQINLPKNGTFVVITTKSSFEDAVRDNAKVFRTKVDIDVAAGPKQAAKYLKATATGYTLTTTKAEASVFYFDGNHLTGLDNGFGLNTTQNKYDLTEDAQKAVVAQGKLEKTLDAGSYSLKVGNKFVKLDNTSGLSVTDNESESHIFLEEATEFKLNTDALGYVSFFAPTAVEILDNVEVYTGKLNAQNSVVNLKKVNTKKIPANTAVLLRKGTSKTSFTVKKIASAPAITDNSLKGYTVSSNKNVANAYGFAVQGGKLVFVPIADGVRAFKAVIFNGNAAGMQEFIPAAFVPTGIEGVTVEENKEEIFDLTGRRVESPVKGQIYVKGGKKFIQK